MAMRVCRVSSLPLPYNFSVRSQTIIHSFNFFFFCYCFLSFRYLKKREDWRRMKQNKRRYGRKSVSMKNSGKGREKKGFVVLLTHNLNSLPAYECISLQPDAVGFSPWCQLFLLTFGLPCPGIKMERLHES